MRSSSASEWSLRKACFLSKDLCDSVDVTHGGHMTVANLLVPAAQYLRMSTENQQYSLQNQSAAIQKYAESKGFEIVHTYSDAGRSGLVLKSRPALRQLLQDVVTGVSSYKAMRCHHPESGALAIARRPPKQIASPIRQIMLAKPFLALEEKFEVCPHHAASIGIQHHTVPVVPTLQPSPAVASLEIALSSAVHLLV